ncbi:MAG: hypothetical protein H6706_21835 [Myxococcales bacterium]|nr:hypothetical protein [Myxococcales bacterium]
MFQLKVAVALALVFGVAGGVLYLQLDEAFRQTARERLEQRLSVARRSLGQARQLEDHALVARAEHVAATPGIAAALARPIEAYVAEDGSLPSADEYRYQIHRLMNDELRTWKTRFAAVADGKAAADGLRDLRTAAPDFLAVVDAEGIGVAQAADPAWFGVQGANVAAEQPALKPALGRATASMDVWTMKDAPMEVAVAPIRQGEKTLGAVIVGYRMTFAAARRGKSLVDTEVAWFVGPRVSQSSSLDPDREVALQKVVADQKLHTVEGDPGVLELTVAGHRFLARLGQASGYQTAREVGYIALLDLDAALTEARQPLVLIPLVCGLGFVLALALVLFFFQRFLKPFGALEAGILDIIHGNHEHWFDLKGKSLPAVMSHNLNIMVCHLTGRPLPDDEEPGAHG